MTDEKLKETFFRDSREFMNTFTAALKDLKEAAASPGKFVLPKETIDDAFRTIHSLKSEAAYLGYGEIASESNEIETRLQSLRAGEGPSAGRGLEEISLRLNRLMDRMEELRQTISAEEDGESGGSAGRNKPLPVPRIEFTEFELVLLSDAGKRGERFYRIVCEVESSETMVYPRLFLLISNLELEANVIRTFPDLAEVSSEHREIEIFLTSNLEREAVYRIVNIDQISRVQITEIDYPSVSTEGGLKSSVDGRKAGGYGRRNYLTVDAGKLSELKTALEEIELLAGSLEGAKELADTSGSAARLFRLASHCCGLVHGLRLKRFHEELLKIRSFAEELSERSGKKLKADVSGGDFELETTFLDHISEIIIHLIRNAVDHGIEAPEERLQAGKTETGSLLVTAEKKDSTLTVQIADDGRGINRDAVAKQARQAGFLKADESVPETLDLLSAPGFTTLMAATKSSGRGYGLDLVQRKVREIPGTELRMTSKPGSGTVFTLIFRYSAGTTRMVFLRTSGFTAVLEKEQIREIEEFDPEKAAVNEDTTLMYRGLPVYTAEGRLMMRGPLPAEQFVVLVECLGNSGALLVDEVLFERDVDDTQIRPGESTKPHLQRVEIPYADKDVFLLRPALLFK